MNPGDPPPAWDGLPLPGDLIGLSWPDPAQPGGAFAAAAEGRVVLVPDGAWTDFLTAHRDAHFVADLDRPHGFDATVGAVNSVVMENRLYDIGLLSELVRMAAPGVSRPLPERPGGPDWVGYSELLSSEAVRLLAHAHETVARIGEHAVSVTRFGPLGIGIDVRGALAAARDGPGLRLTDSGLRRVSAVLDAREHIARTELKNSAAARSLANTRGGAEFLDRGALGDDRAAIGVFVSAILRDARMRGRMPIPTPADLTHLPSWELLAPHSPVAAAAELRAICGVRAALADGSVLRPRADSFPELRSAAPDINYLRCYAGRGIFVPVHAGCTFLVISLPELELRTLAVCLERRYGDTTLSREFRSQRGESVRSRIGGPELASNAVEAQVGDQVAAAVLKYLPRGVTDKALETWLLRYAAGVVASAPQVTAARRALYELAPKLRDYCEGDVARIVAANLGVSRDVLSNSLSEFTAALGLRGQDAEITRLLDALHQTTGAVPLSQGTRLITFFGSGRAFPDNPLACRPLATPAALVGALLASDYVTPTGRIYGGALPLQVVGRDHVELADGVRKAVCHALVAGGFQVAAFDEEEFAVLFPTDGKPESLMAACELVRGALTGWADLVADSITPRVSPVW